MGTQGTKANADLWALSGVRLPFSVLRKDLIRLFITELTEENVHYVALDARWDPSLVPESALFVSVGTNCLTKRFYDPAKLFRRTRCRICFSLSFFGEIIKSLKSRQLPFGDVDLLHRKRTS